MDNLFVKTLLDWLHVMATVIWIGGMFINFMIIRPVVSKVLEPASAGKFTQAVMKRFRILIYASIVILGVSGIPLKIIDENYVSIINFDNNWEIVAFVKHIFYGVLVLLAVYNFEVLSRKMARLAKNGPSAQLISMQNQLKITGMLAMFSALVILVLSSMMRFM